MQNEKNLIDVSEEKSTVSARINKYIAEIYKDREIPVSMVIEVSLIYFLKLSDKEKIIFLNNNLPENVKANDLKIPTQKWNSLLKYFLRKTPIPASVMSMLFKGLAVGAISIISGMLNSSIQDDDDDDYFIDYWKLLFDEEEE